ncbi:MAG: PH domain-containing protein [Nitrolancea sp.]
MSDLQGLMGDGERVMVGARRHPLFLVGHLALYVIGALVLIGVGIWAATALPILVAAILWAVSLIPIGFAAVRFIAWRNEVYAVTNYRIIQVEGILSRRVFDSSLEMVNDILLTQSLFGRMFNYGTIEIITGSDIGLNQLDALKDPYAFKRAIIDARNVLADHGHAQVVDDRQTQLLAALHDLRTSGLLTEAEYEIKRSRLTGGRAG